MEFAWRERKPADAAAWSPGERPVRQCRIQEPRYLLSAFVPFIPFISFVPFISFIPTHHFCLLCPDGVTAFHTFLKTEFSEENLDFWLACEDFKKTRSKTKLASKANRIFEEFVQSEAPREVRAIPASATWC